jgi:hypothetical protein
MDGGGLRGFGGGFDLAGEPPLEKLGGDRSDGTPFQGAARLYVAIEVIGKSPRWLSWEYG